MKSSSQSQKMEIDEDSINDCIAIGLYREGTELEGNISLDLSMLVFNFRLELYQNAYFFCFYFAAELQRCVFMWQSRMYKNSCGKAATEKRTQDCFRTTLSIKPKITTKTQ
jgi:hypothetical protein